MKSEEQEWWYQAVQDDWKAFESLKRDNNYSLAVFHLQQAAEKGLKSLCYKGGRPGFTHSCLELLRKLESMGFAVTEELYIAARRLDPHYTLARYPNGVGGVPRDYYDLSLVEELEQCAKRLMSFVESNQ